MQYRKLTKDGDDISLLGYGCMRFPQKGSSIDKELTFKQLLYAYENGVNYFDTAYPYHLGKSEVVLGEFIKEYNLRDKIFIADKLPAYLVSKTEHIEKYFSTQLSRLQTDYIDYYLMHTLDSMKTWEKLKSLGIVDFINSKKKEGKIRFIGFSFHGRHEEFIKILEDFNWDFTQIQLNYLDENYQAGTQGLKRAHSLGIGTVVMEPLRGGRLASMAPDKVNSLFAAYPQKHSAAFWALRFVMNFKEVSTVLSGMNDIEHIKENIDVANKTLPLSMNEDEFSLIKSVKSVFDELMKVPCTGCNYCVPCPFDVDIPAVFSDYNSKYFFDDRMLTKFQYMARCAGLMGGKKSGAPSCTGCGKCVKLCPQSIDIPTSLKSAHKELDILPMRKILEVIAYFRNK